MAEAEKAVLEVRNLKVEFPGRRGVATALSDVSLSIRPGEILGVVGESGAGKSMTGLAIQGLLERPGRIAEGEIWLGERRIDQLSDREMETIRGREIGAIFQDPLTSLNPLFTVGAQLTETIRQHLGMGKAEARARAISLLKDVGIPSPEDRFTQYPHQFSGGMRQRVVIALALAASPKLIIAEPIRELKLRNTAEEVDARVVELLKTVGLSASDGEKFPHEFSGGQRQRISIARALAGEPRFLVCDEPTSALDVSVQAQVLNLMRKLQDEFGLTYLFISHDLSVVRHMSDRIAVMYLGRIVEEGETEELFARPRHPYTQLLLQTIPNIEKPHRDRVVAAGEVPSPLKPPSGCTFHPRCPMATARCSAELPAVRTLASGTRVACHLVEDD